MMTTPIRDNDNGHQNHDYFDVANDGVSAEDYDYGNADITSSINPSSLLITQSLSDEFTAARSHNDNSGLVHVSTPLILLTALPLFLMAVVGHRFDLGLENSMVISVSRSFVQLMILGMILHPIFVLGMDMPWLVGLCE